MIISNVDEKSIIEKSQDLIEFCLRCSEYFILMRRHTGGIPSAVLDAKIQEKIEELEELKNKNIQYAEDAPLHEIKAYGFNSRHGFKNQFEEQTESMINEVKSYRSQHKDKKDSLEYDLSKYGLYKREISIGGFFTDLDIWDICYFDKGEMDYEKFFLNFFETPIRIGDYEFENFGFADKAENIWMKTLSDHGYLEMNLTDKQFFAFKKIGIPFESL